VQQAKLTASQIGIFLAIAVCPVFMTILPWEFGPEISLYRGAIRSLSVAPTLLQLVIIVIAMENGISIFREWRRLPRITRAALSILAFLCIIPLYMGVEDPIRIPIALIAFFVHVVFALTIFELVARCSIEQRRILARWIAIGVLAYCIVWGASLLHYVPVGDQWRTHVPGVTNVRWVGFFAVSAFFMALASFSENLDSKANAFEKSLSFCLACVALLLAFWTGSRGAIFATLAGIGLLLFAAAQYRMLIFKFAFSALIVGAVASAILPTPPNAAYGIFRFSPVPEAGRDLSTGRISMWIEVAGKVFERPVFGWGLDQFQLIDFKGFPDYRQPHNVILQALISIGFLGCALLAAAILPVVRMAKLKFDSLNRVAAFGLVLSTLIYSLYDAALYYNYPLMMLAVAAALAFAPVRLPAVPDK
jgi:O-antigen ligase